ncbi:MerR family transcriptional regulator [Bacillus mycoides]|uniref:MerR family transcriptional regulator n=1 Tax=Bacillus mycoides TaxID=1405 RepID=UPI003D213BFA
MSQVISLQRPQRLLNSSDVADALNIPPSTLRTYTVHFRRLGHNFTKKNGRIQYSAQDVQLFKKMIDLHEQGFGTITECVLNVVNVPGNVINVHNVVNDVEDTVNNEDKQCKQPENNLPSIETANEIAKIKEEMEELRKYIDESIKKRDQLLIQTLREVLESKQTKQKKKRWWQFWK